MLSPHTIVVTGLGAVSPLGVSVETSWQRLIAGRSGIRRISRFDASEFPCQIAGEVPSRADDAAGFDTRDFVDAKDIKKMDLFIQYALAATREALQQARWPNGESGKDRTAVIIATGVGGFPAISHAVQTVMTRGPRRLSPFTVPSFLPNLATGQISIAYGFTGPSGCPVTACAASAQAIGDGMRLIQNGEADIAVCGGSDACIDPVSIGGFAAAKALATSFNDQPEKASRPFDSLHEGFVLSEGAATVIIERLDHALERRATPLAILSGYGTSTDAYHITAGRPDGFGAATAMRKALTMAGISGNEISYINAHSTSTPVGDEGEINAITSVFPNRGKDLHVSSTKSATGHLLGAAGAIEAVFSVRALQDQMLPPSLNIENPMPQADVFDLVANAAKSAKLDYVMSNGFGFGGVNASLIFKAME